MSDTFRILSRVSKTQSGEIFTCMRCVDPGVKVAVKCMSLLPKATARGCGQPLPDNPRQEQRVAGLLASRGGHGNLVRCYESFVKGGRLFIIMEHCPDGDLHSHIQSLASKALSEPVALRFFREILLGVQFLHQHLGVAHRDLSLENVLLKDGVCKIADFGLSTSASRISTELVGKAYYMAPEVVANLPYDPTKADVWSLGVMLFVMLTGSPLVVIASTDDPGFKALVMYGVEKIFVAWGMRSRVSSKTMKLLSGMLQIDPSQRIRVDEALQLLSRC
ncbi:hypothetical protein Gpo141_00013928 [Globisporangium polare]